MAGKVLGKPRFLGFSRKLQNVKSPSLRFWDFFIFWAILFGLYVIS